MPSTIVGIGGGSCSGKSTLAKAVQETLAPAACQVISTDTYMLGDKGPKITLSTGEEWPNMNSPLSTDLPRLLEDLQNSNAEIVLIEGLMALHFQELLPRYALKIFVDTDAPTRAIRRMVRSIRRMPDTEPEWIGRYYLECAVPGHEAFIEPSRRNADLIVHGNGDTLRTANLLSRLISSVRPE